MYLDYDTVLAGATPHAGEIAFMIGSVIAVDDGLGSAAQRTASVPLTAMKTPFV
jgi:hypothetical protein